MAVQTGGDRRDALFCQCLWFIFTERLHFHLILFVNLPRFAFQLLLSRHDRNMESHQHSNAGEITLLPGYPPVPFTLSFISSNFLLNPELYVRRNAAWRARVGIQPEAKQVINQHLPIIDFDVSELSSVLCFSRCASWYYYALAICASNSEVSHVPAYKHKVPGAVCSASHSCYFGQELPLLEVPQVREGSEVSKAGASAVPLGWSPPRHGQGRTRMPRGAICPRSVWWGAESMAADLERPQVVGNKKEEVDTAARSKGRISSCWLTASTLCFYLAYKKTLFCLWVGNMAG